MTTDQILSSRIIIVAQYGDNRQVSQCRIRCDCERTFKRKKYSLTKLFAICRTTTHSKFSKTGEPATALDTLHVVLRIGDSNGGYTMPKKHNSDKVALKQKYTMAYVQERNDAGLCLTPLAWDTPAARKIMAEINKNK